MTVEQAAPHYAITGMGLGNAEDFRELIAPFVGELLAEAEARGCAPEISPTYAGDDTFALVPERGLAVASAGHDLVVGFLLVVTGSIGGGVAQAVGADIYQKVLKQPIANLAQRLRKKSANARKVTLLAETWIAEDRVLVQAVVHWRRDEQSDLAGVLTDALDAADAFWRTPGSDPPTSASAIDGTRIVRVEIATDGTMTQPVLIEPQHRLPGMPRLHTSAPVESRGEDGGHRADQDGDPGASPAVT